MIIEHNGRKHNIPPGRLNRKENEQEGKWIEREDIRWNGIIKRSPTERNHS